MLSIPQNTELATDEVPKRRADRQRINTLVYADLGPGNGGFPLNISKLGMAFQGIQPLEKGTIICIKLKLPGMNEVVETTGMVVWLNDLGKGGGIEFIDLADDSWHLISHWLSLHTDSNGQIESVKPGPREIEKKELRFPNPPSLVHQGTRTAKSELKFSSLLSSSNTPPAQSDPVSDNDLAVRSRDSKRTWIAPFAIGLATSMAIMIAVMVVLGVISIQFRLPQKGVDASSARPLPETGSAKVVEPSLSKVSPEKSLSDQGASSLEASTPITNTKSPNVEPAKPRVTARESLHSGTPLTQAVQPPQTLPQPAQISKAIAPSPIPFAKIPDFVPPAIAPPSEPGLVPRLSTASPAVPASPSGSTANRVDPPILLQRKDPVYSSEAQGRGILGVVELHFTIDTKGDVRDVKVVKGNPILIPAAVEAIKVWHYQPAKRNGIPIESESSIAFNFKPK